MWTYNYTDELYHHGILGMKWGRRKQRLEELKYHKNRYKQYEKEFDNNMNREFSSNKEMQEIFNKADRIDRKYKNTIDYMNNYNQQKKKKIRNIAIGVGVAAVGAYAVSKILKKKGIDKKIVTKIKNIKAPRKMYDGSIKYTTQVNQIKDRIKNAPFENYYNIK